MADDHAVVRRWPTAILMVILTAALAVPVRAGSDRAAQCAAAKLHAAGQKAIAKLRCVARGVLHSDKDESACLAAAEDQFTKKMARIEARGGCPGDPADIEARVDALVTDLVAAVSPTSSTTTTITSTTGTSCSPTSTLILCGTPIGCSTHLGFCPLDQTCVYTGDTCACSGPPVPCADLGGGYSGSICGLGVCPEGMTCQHAPIAGSCLTRCFCG